jgi:hypothetical protein
MQPAYDLLKVQSYIELLVFDGSSWSRKEDLEERTFTGLFEGQLHVFVLVVVVQISAPVVHRQEVIKTYPLVDLVMLLVVDKQKRRLEELIQGSAVQENDEE